MELNQENVSKVAQFFGISAEDMIAKLTGENEADFKLQGELFTEDQLTARDRSKYNEGKDAGVEMTVKDLKKKYNYEFDGKDVDSFLSHHDEALKSKYSKSGNDRVTELESDLKKQKIAFETEIDSYKNQLETIGKQYKKQANTNYLRSIMPKETTLKPDAIITLFNSEYELDELEGKRVVKVNGEIAKDPKTTEPLDPSNIFNDWLVKEKYISANPGRGGGHEYGKNGYTGIKTIDEFEKKWQAQNPDKNTLSQDYKKDFAEWKSKQN